MIIKPLSEEVAVGHSTVLGARLVRLVNTGATEKVTIANSTAASLTLIANTSIVIEKEVGAAVAATAAVLATPVAFTN